MKVFKRGRRTQADEPPTTKPDSKPIEATIRIDDSGISQGSLYSQGSLQSSRPPPHPIHIQRPVPSAPPPIHYQRPAHSPLKPEIIFSPPSPPPIQSTGPTPPPIQSTAPSPPPIHIQQPASSAINAENKIKTFIEHAVKTRDAPVLESMVVQCKCTARMSYNYKNTNETLLSFALLHQTPLRPIQAIYDAYPEALIQRNQHGMSALHHASTVPTTLDVMMFLVAELKKKGYRMSQLITPGGWSVIHTACRLGVLSVDTFQYVIKHSQAVMGKTTKGILSTPLHLAIFGLERRPTMEQRIIIQQLVQAYPYAVNIENADKNTPVAIAEHVAKKGRLDRDLLEFLVAVQGLVMRKYSTRVQIEQRIAQCQAVLGLSTSVATAFASSSQMSSEQSAGSAGSTPKMPSTALERRAQLRQETLAHIELQMLVPMRTKFMSEERLRELIDYTSKQIEFIPSDFYAQREAMNTKLLELEEKLQREIYAKVPLEIQVTRQALCERLRSKTHLRPIEDVSLQYLRSCTNNFSKENILGKGGFGSVYRAYDGVMCAQYAVKTTDKYDDPSLGRELQILSQVFHPNIIRLFGFYVPPGAVSPKYLVFEYAGGGTMADCLSSEESREQFTWSLRLSAAVGVASALDFLHNRLEVSIAHHDIKPENVVFNDTLDRAILIDCGISKVLKKDNVNFTKTKAGTTFYLPEDYTEDTPYDEKCEVFSFGLVLRVLIAGRVPKSLEDRKLLLNGETGPDFLASWPADVLPTLVDLTDSCVHRNGSERPPIQELYQRLMNLNSITEKVLKLTNRQQMTIAKTLSESRILSRASRNLEAKGKCYCSPNLVKRGLLCPGKTHFQCSECFNKYVLDYLGEEIFCPEESCECSDPYTLEELHQHLSRRIICRHFETRLKNQELDILRDTARLRDEMGQGFDRVMRGITNIGRDELRCPMLALLIPTQISGNRSMVRRALSSWKSSTTKTFFLYFVCAHDNSLVDAPIKVDVKKDWVKKVVPFLRAAIIGISAAVIAVGLPISLPMIESCRDTIQDNLVHNLYILDQMLSDIAGPDEMMERQVRELYASMQGGSTKKKMSSVSYQMVAEVANAPGNTEWRTKMVLAENNGELAWVKKENETRWKNATRRP